MELVVGVAPQSDSHATRSVQCGHSLNLRSLNPLRRVGNYRQRING